MQSNPASTTMNNHQQQQQQQQEMFFDQTSRSPNLNRNQQQIPRQSSRHFDAYGQLPNAFNQDDQDTRFNTNRFGGMGSTMQNGNKYGYELGGSQTWNPNAFSNANHSYGGAFSATSRMKGSRGGRSAIPNGWLDQQIPPMPPLPSMPQMNSYGAMPPPGIGAHQMRNDSFASDLDEELIPTAIVIKNIPFAVKKEQLVDLMTQMNLPLPYAFNYHFDNGVFRGLAFANFTSSDETAAVIDHLNHFELQGRKLRVEYKKMLPIQERERIEREKRERRGQLEEQHRPMGTPGLNSQASMGSMNSHLPAASPSPVSALGVKPDLNDPQTLQFYSELLLFRDDLSREALIFPSTLSPQQRRIVHTLAHHMQLAHTSRGNGEQRQVHIVRGIPGSSISPPVPHALSLHGDSARRVLNRAATTDFSEARGQEALYNQLRNQGSAGYLGIPDSPVNFGIPTNLRSAKSYADLRSYTPSPVASGAFPPALQTNVARFANQQTDGGISQNNSSTTPTLPSTVSGLGIASQRDDVALANGLGNISIGTNVGANGGSPRRLRGMFSWDQADSNNGQGSAGGPIGSNRGFTGLGAFGGNNSSSIMNSNNNNNTLDGLNGTLPMRQPRGPIGERGPGFGRIGANNSRVNGGHQTRGSDELRSNGTQKSVEIIVE